MIEKVVYWLSFALVLVVVAALILGTLIYHEAIEGDFLERAQMIEESLLACIFIFAIVLFSLIRNILSKK